MKRSIFWLIALAIVGVLVVLSFVDHGQRMAKMEQLTQDVQRDDTRAREHFRDLGIATDE